MINATQCHSLSGAKVQKYLAGWQRVQAELSNFKKMMGERSVSQGERSRREAIEPLLNLRDSFQMMLMQVPKEIEADNWVVGVMAVAKQLDSILKDYEVEIIGGEVREFDPKLHEAIEQVKVKGLTRGIQVEVVQNGYVLGDEVIRPAKVKVAK